MSRNGDDAEAFLALTTKIALEFGFGAASYKNGCMRRRIAVRMRARGARDFGAYSRLLDVDPAEPSRLIDALTINVTSLFRNSEVWQELDRSILPHLFERAAGRVSCWVAGCSSGEEAYTLAALCHRRAASRRQNGQLGLFEIVASDIDEACLVAAEYGAYPVSAFAETPPDLRTRYFSADPPHTVTTELQALVRFERRDLLRDPAPSAGLQIITCRNVIIYFDRPSQEAVLRRLHDALAPGGVLVLGKVETLLGPARAMFEVVDHRQRIFRRP